MVGSGPSGIARGGLAGLVCMWERDATFAENGRRNLSRIADGCDYNAIKVPLPWVTMKVTNWTLKVPMEI